MVIIHATSKTKKTKLHGFSPQANYTDRLSDRRLSAKLVPALVDRGCRVVSTTVPPQSLIFGFLDRSRYFLEIAPQLSFMQQVDSLNPISMPVNSYKSYGLYRFSSLREFEKTIK
jgi:hypothetical protein